MRWIRNTEIYGLSSCTSKVSGNLFENYGRFPFNKNSSVKLRKFHVPNGTVHYDCTDPTQATARLVIVLVSRIQKSGTGNNNFVNSVRPTEMSGPLVPGQSKPKWSVPFVIPTEISEIWGWMAEALYILIIIIHSKYFSVSEWLKPHA